MGEDFNMNIHNQIIISLISKEKTLDNYLKQSLTKAQSLLSTSIPLVLEPTPEELSGWVNKIVETKIEPHNLAGNSIRLLRLYDGTFLIVRSDASALHYDSNFSLISALPFDYGTPSSMNSSYEDVSDAIEINFTNTSISPTESTSIIAFCMPDHHVVRLYKYANNTWSLFSTVGTIDSAGDAALLLDAPTSSAMGSFVTGTNQTKINLIVSSFGAGPGSSDSFLKKYVINMSGIAESSVIISYPGINTTGASAGSISRSETKDIDRMLIKGTKLIAKSSSQSEIGVMEINENDTLTTINMKKTKFQDLVEADVLTIPNCFDYDGTNFCFGDTRGHLAKTDISLKTTDIVIGRNLEISENTTYPFQYKNIDDIRIVGKDIYFLSGNKLFSINIGDYEDQSVTLTLDPKGFNYRLEEVFGFINDGGTIKVGVNDENFRNLLDVLDSTIIRSTDFLNVQISSPASVLLKQGSYLGKGIIVISPQGV